jgi:hypothetical protein
MNRAPAWVVRAVALWLAWSLAYVLTALWRSDEPQPTLAEALVPAILIGLVLQAGLLWAPSARGRWRIVAALLMIPSGYVLLLAAVEELQLAMHRNMHEPTVDFTYFVGSLVYLWQFASLIGAVIREHRARIAVFTSTMSRS